MKNKLVFVSLFFFLSYIMYSQTEKNELEKIQKKYGSVIEKIINFALGDSTGYIRLGYFCDTFGHRLSGSESLEKALDWTLLEMKKEGYDSVFADEVMVPHWVRGNEYCQLKLPREEFLAMSTLGGSISTPPEGIEAPVIVVSSFEELHSKASLVKGKIVLYDYPYKGYGDGVRYRFYGAVEASKAGAVASITRSVTPIGFQSAHTGMMVYEDTVKAIPHIAISAEASSMLRRMYERGQNPVLKIYTEAKTLPDAKSRNIIAQLNGKGKNKDEVIAFGGHSDCWDLGTGAHDDASGCFIAWEALRILKVLGISTNRTLRAVFWVNEENGNRGGKAYADIHKTEKHALVCEMDGGLFKPSAIRYTGPENLFSIVKLFKPFLQKIDSIDISNGGGGVDIGPMMRLGVNGMSLSTEDDGKYFWYHHSSSDTFDKIDLQDLRKCIAAVAVSMYLYSEIIP